MIEKQLDAQRIAFQKDIVDRLQKVMIFNLISASQVQRESGIGFVTYKRLWSSLPLRMPTLRKIKNLVEKYEKDSNEAKEDTGSNMRTMQQELY